MELPSLPPVEASAEKPVVSLTQERRCKVAVRLPNCSGLHRPLKEIDQETGDIEAQVN
jgi:hypothetical protein